jgi:murein DD-endopeptidase MepM/ murein hydrolase activator NlpD
MPFVVEFLGSRSTPRVIALALIAAGAAGCTADTSRFNESPYGRNSGPGEVTGSIAPGQPAPVGRVTQNPLPPPAAQGHPVATAAPANGVAGGSRGMGSYTPAPGPSQAAAPEITGSVASPVAAAAPRKPQGQWSWDGGTAITVGQGETLESIAHRHGVPPAALREANGIHGPTVIQPGQRLVIPRYIAPLAAPGGAPATQIVSAAPPIASAAPAVLRGAPAPAPLNGNVHIVAPGETLIKIARTYNKSLVEVAKANNIPPHTKVNIGDRIIIPGLRMTQKEAPKVAEVKPAAPAKPSAPGAKPATPAPAKQPVASAEAPSESAAVATQEPVGPTGSLKAGAADAPAGFRWPVHGRVIAGFGPKTNGQQNDGINVAVPEGTPVKAAEDGVVAYSGNELKGYGNLVLVRHANGYVTAYAHAKELMVKRGDTIKRGQVIAKSGQTGTVDSPQLHFEIRKGPSPVDPMPMLSGG